MPFLIRKLDKIHTLADFDCGNPALNGFLVRHALQNQAMGGAQTYVGLSEEGAVVGYYSLAVGSVAHAEAPDRLVKGLARHPVPVMILARLAASLAWRGKGIGAGLLRDALLRTEQAADIAGMRAMVVHAKDEPARQFYLHFGFSSWPDNTQQLCLLLKDMRAALG
jgi:GNAT superfamily N-acetyltransferase